MIEINLTQDEIEDLIANLSQCESEGYLHYGDPAYSALEKLKNYISDLPRK